MCGRYTSTKPIDVYAELFQARAGDLFVGPRYNIAPTYDVLACRALPEGRELTLLHWGLIPAWAEDRKIGYRTINARAETVAAKPAYRTAFRHRRCLIAANRNKGDATLYFPLAWSGPTSPPARAQREALVYSLRHWIKP